MALTVVTPPRAEPMGLAEAKLHLRVDPDMTDDDGLIQVLIAAARESVEDGSWKALVTRELELTLDVWPKMDRITLPLGPLRKVVSLSHTDTQGAAAEVPVADYVADTKSKQPRVSLAYGKSWPSVTLQPVNGVSLQFVAGYATPFTVDAGTDTLTAPGHPYANGDRVRLSNSGGSLPGGLEAMTDYYVVGATSTTLQLAATAGSQAIDITSAGNGAHFLGEIPARARQAMLLLIGHWYEHREEVNVGNIVTEMPDGAKSLLRQLKW